MQAFHLTVAAISVTALCLSLFTIVSDLNLDTATHSANLVTGNEDLAVVPEQVMQDIAALKKQVALLITASEAVPEKAEAAGLSKHDAAILKKEVAALRQQLDSVVANQEEVIDNKSFNSQVLFADELEMIGEEEALKHKQRIDSIDAVFQAEPNQSEWSIESTELIMQAFETGELAQSDLLAAECRTSMCKVEVRHGDWNDFEMFHMQFMVKVGDVLPSATMEHHNQEDGSVTSVIYLARENFEFPAR